jgi:hypothetical protein
VRRGVLAANVLYLLLRVFTSSGALLNVSSESLQPCAAAQLPLTLIHPQQQHCSSTASALQSVLHLLPQAGLASGGGVRAAELLLLLLLLLHQTV